MKKCPNCGHILGFGEFVTRYGSDTLIKHSIHKHPLEHICGHCRHKVWLHYDHQKVERFSLKYAGGIFLAGSFISFMLVRPWMNFTITQTLLFIGIVLLFGIPVGVAYAKYQSVSVRTEK